MATKKYLNVVFAFILLTGCGTPDLAPTGSGAVPTVDAKDGGSPSTTPSTGTIPGQGTPGAPSPGVPGPGGGSSPSPTPSASGGPVGPYRYSGGMGTITNPFLVSNAIDFQNIELNPAAYFSVTQDISFEYAAPLRPIVSFSGVLYGNNRILYQMRINTTGTDRAAIFLTMSGTLVEVKVYIINIISQSYGAVFADRLTGFISTCSVGSGNITAPLDGNGYNTGVGNPIYHTKSSTGVVSNTTQRVVFNGNTVNYPFP